MAFGPDGSHRAKRSELPNPTRPDTATAPPAANQGAPRGEDSVLEQDRGFVVIELSPTNKKASPEQQQPAPATLPAPTTFGGAAWTGSDTTTSISGATAASSTLTVDRFPYWEKPSAWSAAATALVDLGTWASFLGVGIPLENYRLSGMVAAGVSLAGVALQVYRYVWERSLRTLWKVHPALLSATWVINGVFCACASRATAQRYSLFLVISGVLVASVISLALGRPVLLEQALEQVASREEEEHPIFQRSCRRLSYGLLVLNLLQWPCFFVAAVFLSDAHDMVILALVAILPVSFLLIYIGLAFVYGFVERALLEVALRTGVSSSEGIDIPAVVLRKLKSLLPFLRTKEQQQQQQQQQQQRRRRRRRQNDQEGGPVREGEP